MEFRSLVNEIEAYLKSLLKESPEGAIEVRRKDVAEIFNCAPSQVTYVLNTRFNVRRGYLVESRRGGGGYIRICSVFKVPGVHSANRLKHGRNVMELPEPQYML